MSNVFQNKQDVPVMQKIRKMGIIHITKKSHQIRKKKKRKRTEMKKRKKRRRRKRRERRRESDLCWRKLITVYQRKC